eukprot:7242910-Karenia_brevis.AAC.1
MCIRDRCGVESPVTWQCGLLGIRVGEASHPGPSSDDENPISPWKQARHESLEETPQVAATCIDEATTPGHGASDASHSMSR